MARSFLPPSPLGPAGFRPVLDLDRGELTEPVCSFDAQGLVENPRGVRTRHQRAEDCVGKPENLRGAPEIDVERYRLAEGVLDQVAGVPELRQSASRKR